MAYVTTIIFGEKLASLSMIYYCVHWYCGSHGGM